MKNSTMISYVGDSDPYRHDSEGSLMHIIHEYRPLNGIIIFSHEMHQREEEKHAIENFMTFYYKKLYPEKTLKIRKIHSSDELSLNDSEEHCLIQFLFTDLDTAQDFDVVNRLSVNVIMKLSELNYSGKLLLNVSSGTPQMKQSFSILGVYYYSHFEIHLIQVDTPVRRSNRNSPHEDYDLGIEDLIFEQEESEGENRCSEQDFLYLHRIFTCDKLISYIKRYDYIGAEKLLKENAYVKNIVNKETGGLIKHWSLRSEHKIKEADECSLPIPVLNRLNPIDQPYYSDIRKLYEYFLILQMNFKKRSLNAYLIQMSPYLTNLLSFYLSSAFPSAYDAISMRDSTRGRKLIRSKIERYDRRLIERLRFNYEGDKDITLNNLLIVFQFFLERNLPSADDAKNLAVFNKMLELRDVERKLRNSIAHQLFMVDDEQLRKNSISLNQMNQDIIVLSKITFPNIKPYAWDSFLEDENLKLQADITLKIKDN